MKALTLWQPWASLVALGHKRIETRCWSTKYRGDLAIHSAANIPAKWLGASRHQPKFRDALADIFNARRDCDERLGFHVDDAIKKLPRGKVLCVVRLDDVREINGDFGPEFIGDLEHMFGNYESGRYAWYLNSLRLLEDPISAKGNRLLWNWNELR